MTTNTRDSHDFQVRGELTQKTMEEICDELVTLVHGMRSQVANADAVMHLAADALVTYGKKKRRSKKEIRPKFAVGYDQVNSYPTKLLKNIQVVVYAERRKS